MAEYFPTLAQEKGRAAIQHKLDMESRRQNGYYESLEEEPGEVVSEAYKLYRADRAFLAIKNRNIPKDKFISCYLSMCEEADKFD